MFLHNLRWPLPSSKFVDLEYTFGLANVQKFNIQNIEVVSAPMSTSNEDEQIVLKGYKLEPPSTLVSAKLKRKAGRRSPIILFFHGNGSSRALSWRRTHVMNLASANAIVYSFDVRGFGDVGGSPSQASVLQDTLSIYNFVRGNKEESDGRDIFLYGHSLGTALVSHLAHSLCGGLSGAEGCLDSSHEVLLAGVILDSPFVNATAAALHHPSTLPIRFFVPFAKDLILGGLVDTFQTDRFLSDIDVPVFIIQGSLDNEIPPALAGGLLLEKSVVEKREANRKNRRGKRVIGMGVNSVQRLEVKGANHENVHETKDFTDLVASFMQACNLNFVGNYSRKELLRKANLSTQV